MGTLTFSNQKFYYIPSPDDHRTQPYEYKYCGLKFNEDTLRWETRSAHKAVKLRRFADESAERKLKNTFITDYASPEQIFYPDHLEPHTWQIESAWWALTRSPCYIADEAGLGKTVTACLCMNTGGGRSIIICPAFLKYNWQKEITKWCGDGKYSLSVIEGGDTDERAFSCDVVILPDSLLTNVRVKSLLKKQKFKWLFVDEAHRYKTDTAQRTIALLGNGNDEGQKETAIRELAERTVFLSGTPIPNGKPIELFGLLSRSAPEAIDHRSSELYGKEFCGGKRVTRFEGRKAILHWDFSGATNLGKLNQELKRKFMIRHEKKDCLKELGPKTRQLIFLDNPDGIKKFEQKELTHIDLDALMGKEHSLGDIATYRRMVGQSKIIPAFEYINQLLENSREKIVVFAHHIEVVTTLHRMLRRFNPLLVKGGMSAKEKQAQVSLFQRVGSHRVIVGNIDSIGVGNTLTKAPRAIFVEASWSPGVNEQAEDRIHRITQDKHVYIQYLVLRNSLDERMLSKVLAKEKNIQKAMS